ncbi:gamma-glutamylcyclotransferase [Palleronia sp. THAF1]|uniref:gamma-glutamylcyclotransferase family protein n=1 Tax=Palleronia sp. THAF1 TaxID=2587842 RepID=UPI000F54214F|nr:gamma-glutamylcyclotransferase family protein [Palleronia sp. THAF1]
MKTDPFIGDRVFVYGTLRRGFINNDATLAFREGASFIAEGTLPGGLYSVGWYPALIEGEEGRVHGEVWKITQPGIMHILDDYEGLFDDGPPEYQRARRMVETAQGRIEAWAYIYLYEVDPMQRLPKGDWADAFNTPGVSG